MSDWLVEARKLPLGRKRRVHHDCSTDRSMLVSHNTNGYSAYCFRCGPVGFHAHGYMSLAQRAEIRALNVQAYEHHDPEVPDDITEIPIEHRWWLAGAGFSAPTQRQLGMGWSPRLSRVVLPLTDSGGVPRLWTARAVRMGHTPKYLNPSCADKASRCYWPHHETHAPRDRGVCITEDWLSAARVASHVQACTALGTTLSDRQAVELLRHADGAPILIWLDPDSAGRNGAASMYRKMRLLGAETVRIIESEVDPKNHTDAEISAYCGVPYQPRWRRV